MAIKSTVVLLLACLLCSCGIKGDLQRPSDVKQEEPKPITPYGSLPVS